MIVTRLGHAALLVESDHARVLVDPGGFSDLWHDLTDLDAILVTHQHGDHLDVEQLPALTGANPRAALIVEPQCVELVADHDATPALVGESLTLGDLTVEMVGGVHALIHPDVPLVGNVGYLFSGHDGPRLLHPGDAYDTAPSGVDVLALPLTAPWAKVADTVEFARTVAPSRIVPIHDAIVSPAGRRVYVRMVTNLCDAEFTDVEPGEPLPL